MLPGNHFCILYASFDVYGVKLGCRLGMGSSKRMIDGGVGKIPWFLFCPFLKYLTRYVLQTCYVDENHHFLTYSAKNLAKIPCFYDFLAKNWFLLIFMYIFNVSKFPRARWLYIWSLMVLILVSMDRGGTYLYTGSKYRGITLCV